MNDDPYTLSMQLCDNDGLVTGPFLAMHNRMAIKRGFDPQESAFTCTGHAHYGGDHVRCTSPAHDIDARTAATVVNPGTLHVGGIAAHHESLSHMPELCSDDGCEDPQCQAFGRGWNKAIEFATGEVFTAFKKGYRKAEDETHPKLGPLGEDHLNDRAYDYMREVAGGKSAREDRDQ